MRPDQNYLPIADDFVAKDFILKADVTWEACGLLVCGSVFRAEPNLFKGKQYMFSYVPSAYPWSSWSHKMS